MRLAFMVAAFVLALMGVGEPVEASHINVNVCERLDAELAEHGTFQGDDAYAYVMHTVGCDPDTLGRESGMCNRFAYRITKAALYSGTTVLNVLEYTQYRTEEQSSNGHPCRQYEDGTYGFPSKQIDCMTDPRC